jgi:SAM-dependent methyltransferase
VSSPHDERHGARQPRRFDPARIAKLDDPVRLGWVPPEDVVRLLDAPRDGLIVDFGSGTGMYGAEIARRRPDLRVLALDEQPEMLERIAARIAHEQIANLEAIDPGALGPLRGAVDRVLALNVLHELGDDALAALVALLRPGGGALVIDWNADVERPAGPPPQHAYGPAEAHARLARFGDAQPVAAAFPYHHAFVVRPQSELRRR